MRFFRGNVILWRLYVIIALAAAGLLAPLAYAAVPWSALLAYLYLVFHPEEERRFGVPLAVMLALVLPLFFAPAAGLWPSPLFALPVLPLLDRSLRQYASGYNISSPIKGEGVAPTTLALSLVLSLSVVALLSLALNSPGLLPGTALVTVYLAAVGGLVLFRNGRLPRLSLASTPARSRLGAGPVVTRPVKAAALRQRIIAGDFTQAPVRLLRQEEKSPRSGGYLSLYSPYPWFHIRPDRLVPDKPEIELTASLTPPLAGPASISVAARYIDPWGLTRHDFTLEVMELLVIPRARYAEWLARKYLEASRGGGREAIPAMAAATPRRAARQGIEFYGLRAYQPGDSARVIDWKHTAKLHRIIVKEFLDRTTECAVLAVNLAVAGAEEKDRLVFDLITGALTLAREDIPAALAAYNDREVVQTSPLLDPREVLVQALRLTQAVTISMRPRRYLAIPDVSRLRANIHRLDRSGTGAAGRLAGLLRLEYAALGEETRKNPATGALTKALAGVKGKVNILVVSARNHDAVALAFNRHLLEGKGYRFIG